MDARVVLALIIVGLWLNTSTIAPATQQKNDGQRFVGVVVARDHVGTANTPR
jgi:hypothetical protein